MRVFLYTFVIIFLISCQSQSLKKKNNSSTLLISFYCNHQVENIYDISKQHSYIRPCYTLTPNDPLIFFVGNNSDYNHYHITICNRWGDIVFHNKSLDTSWNGKHYKTGKSCPGGTYYMIIVYTKDSSKGTNVHELILS